MMKRIPPKRRKIILIAAAFAAAFLTYAHLETYWIEIKKISVHDPKLPAEFWGKKIVFIADIHCGEGFGLDRVDGLIEKINLQKPDMVLFGGDYVSRNGKNTDACFKKFSRIISPLGKFGVLGNHDIEAGKEQVLMAMRKYGITPLINGNRLLNYNGAQITIAGTDETWYEIPDGKKAMENASEFTVYMTHDPAYLEQYQDPRSKIILAGHTHGGQVTLFGIPFAGLIHGHDYAYEKGIFEESGRTIVITNGIGTGIVPLRFFAQPQINLIILEK